MLYVYLKSRTLFGLKMIAQWCHYHIDFPTTFIYLNLIVHFVIHHAVPKHNLAKYHKMATLMATSRVATVLFVFQELDVHDSAFQLR